MPFNADLSGLRLGPVDWSVSPRRVLAFRAVIAPDDPAGLDDARPGGLPMAPMAVVSPEWVLALMFRAAPGQTLSDEEARQVVHAGQDSRFLRPVMPGETLRFEAELIGARASRAGTVAAIRYCGFDAAGQLVSDSLSTSVYRGVETRGGEATTMPVIGPFDPPDAPPWRTVTTPFSAGFPHAYTECAEIWNPIHTERAIALAAGLPDIIVHGTALWAAAGAAVARELGVGLEAISRLAARFEAPCLAGTAPELSIFEDGSGFVFAMADSEGRRLMSGRAELRQSRT